MFSIYLTNNEESINNARIINGHLEWRKHKTSHNGLPIDGLISNKEEKHCHDKSIVIPEWCIP